MAKSSISLAGLKEIYSFDHLVVGPNNHVAVAACLEIVKSPGDAYNPLFVYGPPGVGKTHLMQAVAHQILTKNPEFKVRYISAERFVSDILMAISEDRTLEVRRMYSTLDLLIIDDVQYLMESKVSQEEFFHIFNNLHQANSQVILAADRLPNQLTVLNENIRTRLEWGLSTDIKVPNEVTRLEILKKKQVLQQIELSDEMLVYAARVLRSNVRELEGFLKRMHAYVNLSKQKITMELVKSVVREILPQGASDVPLEEAPKATAPVNAPEPELPIKKVEKASPDVSLKEEVPVEMVKEPVAEISKIDSTAKIENEVVGENVVELEPLQMAVPETVQQKSVLFDVVVPGSDALILGDIEVPSFPVSPQNEPSSFDLLLQSIDDGVSKEKIKAADLEKSEENKKSPIEMQAPPPPPPPPLIVKSEHKAEVENIDIAPEPPTPPVVKIDPLPSPEVVEATEEDEEDNGQKAIGVVIFYPDGMNEALETVHRKFQEVIKKHKLKFRLKRVHNEPYKFKGKINYSSFVDVCKANKVPVAIVIGPPPETFIPEQDFYDLLTVTLDVQGVSLQLVNWGEINKDYRYLNLSLDIALVRSR